MLTRFYLIAIFIFSMFTGYTAAQTQTEEECPPLNLAAASEFAFRYDRESDDHILIQLQQFTQDYLNAVGSSQGLAETIPSEIEGAGFYTDAFHVDVDADGIKDMLVLHNISFGGGWEAAINVFSCTDGAYQHRSETRLGNTGHGLDKHVIPEIIIDGNANGLLELFLRVTMVQQKYHQEFAVYEWTDERMEDIAHTGFSLGFAGDLIFKQRDSDITTLEFELEEVYAYGQATATAVIELTEFRPIHEVYQWNGETYTRFCRYFTDSPDLLYQVFQSAEAYRECGQYDNAVQIYEALVDDYNKAPDYQFTGWTANASISRESIEGDEGEFLSQLERDYLTAFALYRLVQINLWQFQDLQAWDVQRWLTYGQENFPPGKRGYRYVAMAETLVNTYDGNLTAACNNAYATFETIRDTENDPPIPYDKYGDGDDSQAWTTPFYTYSGFAYNADPDNLFAVPEDLGGMVYIPVCLTSE